jgi:hypothetical protein
MVAVSNSVKDTMTTIKTVINFINHGHPQLPPRLARWLIAASLCSPENKTRKTVSPRSAHWFNYFIFHPFQKTKT